MKKKLKATELASLNEIEQMVDEALAEVRQFPTCCIRRCWTCSKSMTMELVLETTASGDWHRRNARKAEGAERHAGSEIQHGECLAARERGV